MSATHDDIMDRLGRGDDRFRRIEEQQAAILAALEPLKGVREDVAATKEIVEAWAAVKTMGKFIKWAGGLILVVSGVLVAMKSGLATIMGGIR